MKTAPKSKEKCNENKNKSKIKFCNEPSAIIVYQDALHDELIY